MHIISLFFLTGILVYAAYSDIKFRIIPDCLIKTLICLKFADIILSSFFKNTADEVILFLLSGIIISLPLFLISHFFKKLAHRKAFGGGDIKLLFASGIYFYPEQAILVLLIALVTAAFYGAVNIIKTVFRNIFSYRMVKLHAAAFAPAVLSGVLYITIQHVVTVHGL